MTEGVRKVNDIGKNAPTRPCRTALSRIAGEAFTVSAAQAEKNRENLLPFPLEWRIIAPQAKSLSD